MLRIILMDSGLTSIPKSCEDCPKRLGSYSYCTGKFEGALNFEKRPDFCPIIGSVDLKRTHIEEGIDKTDIQVYLMEEKTNAENRDSDT